MATDLFAQLGIEKAQIQKRRPWQNYVRRVGARGIPVSGGGGGEPYL
jgi:hypothetical protein